MLIIGSIEASNEDILVPIKKKSVIVFVPDNHTQELEYK